MKYAGQIVLVQFPRTSLEPGKIRPVLMLAKTPGVYDDWLICMISTQTRHYVPGFDEIIAESDADFIDSGLQLPSLIRVGRLAVAAGDVLLGSIGEIAAERLHRIRTRLAVWIEDI